MNASSRCWFEYRHLVTFGDTNLAGSVYFAKYFAWQGECREKLLAQFYAILIRLTVSALTRSRIEFEFEFTREPDGRLLGHGKQAVIWTNAQHRPSLMPDKLYDATADYFGLGEP